MGKPESVGATSSRTAAISATRRGFLLLGLGLLAGCAKKTTLVMLPDPPWPALDVPPLYEAETVTPRYEPLPDPRPLPSLPSRATVLARTKWAQGEPATSQMNRLSPVRYITVHHDGMDPFFDTDQRATAARIEAIRRAHRRRGWGDIGYHYVVDRAGRVWEGRSLRYQGAHVKNHNYANIGIVVLGNFDKQQPSQAQLASVRQLVGLLMDRYHVPASRVSTHQEWASTRCPGRNLQKFMNSTRQRGRLG
jgi:hypothetical protein